MPLAKIVHVITKLELGGAQLNTLYTVTHLDKGKFLPYLISGEEGILDTDAEKSGLPFFKVTQMVREVRPHKDISALSRLTSILRRIRGDEPRLPVIAHTHSSKAGILGRWAACFARCEGIVHTYHGFGFNDEQSAPVRAAFVWAERITRPITDRFICVSRNNIEKGVEEKVLRPERTSLIRSGISIGEFSSKGKVRKSLRETIGAPDDVPLVGMIACMKPQKAPLDFVEIAARVARDAPNARFIVAGDGELRPDMEARIAEKGLGDKLKLLGWRRDVPELMAAMDVLVLPSLWEGLPRVIPQAWAASLPVVVTAVDGSAEAVTDGENGFLFQPHDVEGGAAKVVELVKNTALRKKFAAAGLISVAEFDIDLMVRQQEQLYENMLTSR